MSNYVVHPLLRAPYWQERMQIEELRKWWSGGARGVCALIGMAGAGKTAIVDKFVEELLEPDKSNQSCQIALRPIFVYSFYDDDKPSNFFRKLQIWIEGNSNISCWKTATQLIYDLQQHEGLLILDGLEMVQDSGRQELGTILSPEILDLVSHVAAGSTRNVAIVATSRFPLSNLCGQSPRLFKEICVDQISVRAGVSLLRANDIDADESELEQIVEECGRHALTVDLAGGYIREFLDSKPPHPFTLASKAELENICVAEFNLERRAVRQQGIRFLKLADRYRRSIAQKDKATLALLERLCLFPQGVARDSIENIFLGKGKKRIAGRALSELDHSGLSNRLDWLSTIGLVEEQSNSDSQACYSIHPAVKDGFLAGLKTQDASACHNAIRSNLETILASAPRETTSSCVDLDLLEDIFHHTLEAGNVRDAWHIYKNRLGGCQNLIAKRSDFPRVARLTKRLLDNDATSTALSDSDKIVLHNDAGISLRETGSLTEAIAVLDFGFQLCQSTDSPNLPVLGSNLAQALRQAGFLRKAKKIASGILPFIRSGSKYLHVLNLIAFIETDLGQPWIRISKEDVPSNLVASIESKLPYRVHSENSLATCYIDVPSWKEDLATMRRENGDELSFAELLTSYSIVCSSREQYGEAQEVLSEAYEWARRHSSKPIICECHILRAKLLLRSKKVSDQDLRNAEYVIDEGLRIARSGGYSLHFSELLLLKAKLQLFFGMPEEALNNIQVATIEGIPKIMGQPVLLGAQDLECGFAWPVPEGLQLKAQSLLLLAAQKQGARSFDPMRRNELLPQTKELVSQAENLLIEARELWQPLHDPAPESSEQNFNFDGKPHNFRAAETQGIAIDLENGTLTEFPIMPTPIQSALGQTQDQKKIEIDIRDNAPELTEADPSYGLSKDEIEHVIVLVHGIRDIGAWQSKVSSKLAVRGTVVKQIRFGLYPAVRFLFPLNLSAKPVSRVVDALSDFRGEYRKAKFSVIAHSFGTYVTLRAMKKDPNIEFWKMIFCGSVADDQTRWSELKHRIGDGERATSDFVLNDCGTGDVWPVIGAAFGWYYGMAGTTGFSEGFVTNRFHKVNGGGHGLYFEPTFVENKWRPFLIDDAPPSNGDGEQGEDLPWLIKQLYNGLVRCFCKVVAALFWIFLFATPFVLAVLFFRPHEINVEGTIYLDEQPIQYASVQLLETQFRANDPCWITPDKAGQFAFSGLKEELPQLNLSIDIEGPKNYAPTRVVLDRKSKSDHIRVELYSEELVRLYAPPRGDVEDDLIERLSTDDELQTAMQSLLNVDQATDVQTELKTWIEREVKNASEAARESKTRITPGMKIRHKNAFATICCLLERENETYLLTSGAFGEGARLKTISGEEVATVVESSFNQFTMFGLAKLDEGVEWVNTLPDLHTVVVPGELTSRDINRTRVVKYGATSGTTNGVVNSTDMTANIDGGMMNGLIEIRNISGKRISEMGDAGAPVFVFKEYRGVVIAELVGMEVASTQTLDTSMVVSLRKILEASGARISNRPARTSKDNNVDVKQRSTSMEKRNSAADLNSPPHIKLNVEFPFPEEYKDKQLITKPLTELLIWENTGGPIYHCDAKLIDLIEVSLGTAGEMESFRTYTVKVTNSNHTASPIFNQQAESAFFVSPDHEKSLTMFDDAIFGATLDVEIDEQLNSHAKKITAFLNTRPDETRNVCHLKRLATLVKFTFVNLANEEVSLYYRFGSVQPYETLREAQWLDATKCDFPDGTEEGSLGLTQLFDIEFLYNLIGSKAR